MSQGHHDHSSTSEVVYFVHPGICSRLATLGWFLLSGGWVIYTTLWWCWGFADWVLWWIKNDRLIWLCGLAIAIRHTAMLYLVHGKERNEMGSSFKRIFSPFVVIPVDSQTWSLELIIDCDSSCSWISLGKECTKLPIWYSCMKQDVNKSPRTIMTLLSAESTATFFFP